MCASFCRVPWEGNEKHFEDGWKCDAAYYPGVAHVHGLHKIRGEFCPEVFTQSNECKEVQCDDSFVSAHVQSYEFSAVDIPDLPNSWSIDDLFQFAMEVWVRAPMLVAGFGIALLLLALWRFSKSSSLPVYLVDFCVFKPDDKLQVSNADFVRRSALSEV